jgi:hypothetical protein
MGFLVGTTCPDAGGDTVIVSARPDRTTETGVVAPEPVFRGDVALLLLFRGISILGRSTT